MYIDIALTPLEESIFIATLFALVLLVLVLLFRPRLFTRGLAPILALAAGNTSTSGALAGVNGMVVGDPRRTSRGASVSVGGTMLVDQAGGTKGGSPSLVEGSSGSRRRSFLVLLLRILDLRRTRRIILKTYTRMVLTIRDNPDEFGHGWMGYFPIPTYSLWTTFTPILHFLGRVFDAEIQAAGYGGAGLPGDEGVLGVGLPGEGEDALTLKERKGSVGLGIVGVDVITPVISTGSGMMITPMTTLNNDNDKNATATSIAGVPAEIQSQVGILADPSVGDGNTAESVTTTTTSPKSTFRFSESYDMVGGPGSPSKNPQIKGSPTLNSASSASKMNWMSDPFARDRGRAVPIKSVDEDEGEAQRSEGADDEGGLGRGTRALGFPIAPTMSGGAGTDHATGSGTGQQALSFGPPDLEMSPGSTGPDGMGSVKAFVIPEGGSGPGGPSRPHRRSRSTSRTDIGVSTNGESGIFSPGKMKKVLEDEEVVVNTGAELPSLDLQPQLIPFTPFPDRIERSRTRRTTTWLLRKGKRSLVSSYARLAGPVGLCGIVAVVGMVAWETGRCWLIIARVVWNANVAKRQGEVAAAAVGEAAQRVIRRGLMGLGEMTGTTTVVGTTGPPGQEGLLRAIIPGLTVPLSHIFPIVGTLIACQVVHEAGHVIAAAMDSITPTRLGLNLHLIIPAASVTFPKAVADLAPASRLRMAASGPWNNLLTWIILTLIASTRLWTFIYHDYSDQGRVVLDINSRSGLAGHIPVGSIVEYLDDTSLRGDQDSWSEYLWDDVFDETRGWCIDKKRYLATQKAPCPPAAPVQFTSLPSNATDATIQCLPPYPLLTSRTWSCPCSSPLKICVKPLASENILRIQWRDARAGLSGLLTKEEEVESIVVLWSGEKREVWDSMRVSRWAGKGGLLGRWMIGWIELVFSYTAMLSLSLALLNLLPLPGLDGAHMIEAVLDRAYPTTSKVRPGSSAALAADQNMGDQDEKGLVDPTLIELETLESDVGAAVRRRSIGRAIEFGMVGLTVMMLGGQILVWLL